MSQKITKLVLYESYVKKLSFRNYKDYFHKTLQQPIVVFKLKDQSKSLEDNEQPDLSQNSILEVLYCNQRALKDVFDEGKCILEQLTLNVDGEQISLGTAIAQKIEQSKANNQAESFKTYDFLKTGEENFIPGTEFFIQQQNGTMEKVKKYYSVMWNTCIWEGQHACILQISDLTLEHEKAEKIQWQRINEYKDELLATVSHDLKTPLNSILISIQAMSYDSPVAEFDEHREMLLTNAQYLDHLISDIMDYSMISKGKLRIVPVSFSIETLLNKVKKLFTDQCSQKNIALLIENELQIDEYRQQTIFSNIQTSLNKNQELYNDEKRITQILINLISNALKFTSKGSITVRVWQEQDDSNTLNISIRDTGSGIPLDLQPRLFEMFSTFDHNRGQNKHGVGLGLCISQKLASLVGPGNRINMNSVPGEGSCFSFSIHKNVDQIEYQNQQVENLSDLQRDSKDLDQEGDFFVSQTRSNNQIGFQENTQVILQNTEITMNLMGLRKPELRKLAKIFGSQEQNILVVDDYPYNIRAVQILFQKSRFQIEGATSADNGKQVFLNFLYLGISMMQAKKYDLALFDVNMPIKDGITLTREVRQLIAQNQLPDICIIQCTAYDTEQDRNICLEAGADGFLSKPITYEKLIKSVQLALEQFRQRQKVLRQKIIEA